MYQAKSHSDTSTPGSSDDLRDDIRQTRGEMDETLDQLGERLHPRHLLDELIEIFKPSGNGSSNVTSTMQDVSKKLKAGTKTIGRYAQNNPVPTLLMVAGVGWAIYDAANESEDEEFDLEGRQAFRPHSSTQIGSMSPDGPNFSTTEFGADPKDESEHGPGFAGKAKGVAGSVGSALSGAASDTAENVTAGATQVADASKKAWQGAKRQGNRGYRQTVRATRAAGDYVNDGINRTKDGMNLARDRFDDASEMYPLAVAGGFIAAGLLAGLLLPRTRTEDEWIGEASDDAWDEAKSMGADVLEQGKQKLAETASAAMDEAETQGLGPESLSEKAGQVAAKASDAAKKSKSTKKNGGRTGGDTERTGRDAQL